MNAKLTKFARYAWGVLGYNILVILFGAYVRASGSGAGCGAHWPLCNGEVIPRPERIETIIELTHRVTSGLTIPLILVLVVWAWRLYGKGSPVRTSSALSVLFIVTESLVGAGLVLFELVADNESVARAIWMMAHLVNTFLLVASLAVTAWWATTSAPDWLRLQGFSGALLIIGALAILVLGASGAVTALGDTLYPSKTLAEGVAQDFSPTAPWLIQLRIFHPGIAVSVGVYLFLATLWVRKRIQLPMVETLTNVLFGLYVTQIILGTINVALLAPIWMQIVHLLASNLVWLAFVLLSAVVFGNLAPGLSHEQVNHPVHAVAGK